MKNGKTVTNGRMNQTKPMISVNDKIRDRAELRKQIAFDEYKAANISKETFEEGTLITAVFAYLGVFYLALIGLINQLLLVPKVAIEKGRKGYAPLFDAFETFYIHYLYRRLRDCGSKPIIGVPGDTLELKERITKDNGWTFEYTGKTVKCINLGSYNYLGFAQNVGPCADDSSEAVEKYGVATCSPRRELGTNPLHIELEKLTAEFLGADEAIVFAMGFATNALNLPSILTPGCLVISDIKNHASIILGLRISGATIAVYKHNNVKSLEEVMRKSIVTGQPDGTPWKKILIILEGVFSMDGSIVPLPEIVALKKKYGAYIYLDEAHSIGATGPRGRGICDFYNVDPKDIDILMGTFTKSFGSAGGYIAGNKDLINTLRINSHAASYASSMAPAVTQQIITSMKIMMGLDGTGEGKKRIDNLARNTRYFRRRLAQMGVIIYGHEDSPVVPIFVFFFSKIVAVIRTLADRNVAVCGAGFPATPLMGGRIRCCLSAAHTKEQLDYVLSNLDEIGTSFGLKYSLAPRDPNPIEY